MAAPTPPSVWQRDITRAANDRGLGDKGALGGSNASTRYQSSEQLSEAYRHVRHVGMDARKDLDLADLLASTRREETYQQYWKEWPSLLRPLSPTLFELPAMVQDKYKTCQTMCFCGLFPELKRAWASVDNSLFLWRYDKSGDVPLEYCGEEQAICAVGLVQPRPGVLLEAVRHVIVLCTTFEVVLLGVCYSRDADDLTLQLLPGYSVPSDGVIVAAVAGSPQGRIFLGASDGHVYEVLYNPAGNWRQKRCSKVRVSGGLQQYLPSFLPQLLGLGAPAAVEKLCVDSERHILYALLQSGAIQVYDLGASGADTPRKVAEINDFYAAAAAATNGREVFRSAGGGQDRKAAAVRHIAPIAMCESSKLHLLAVTADGRRVYFSTQYPRSNYGYYNGAPAEPQRPVTLVAMYARPALPHASVPIGRVTTDLPRSGALEVVSCHYSSGTLLVSEATGADGRATQLLLACRNATLPPLALNVSAASGSPGLRELVSQLDNFVPGETCALASAPCPSLLGPEASRGLQGDELIAQLFRPPPRFVLISTAGVLELEKRRPLEVLACLLEERSPELRNFFEAFGAHEAAAMCTALACARPGTVSSVVVREAVAALDNPLLVGEPRMPEDILAQQQGGQGADGAGQAGNGRGGIYMGQAVNPNPEPDWSAAHKGLCLYLSRLLAPVWEAKLVAPSKGNTALLAGNLSQQTMQVLEDKLRCLSAFLADYLARRQARGYSRYSPRPGGLGAAGSAAGGAAAPGGFGVSGPLFGGLGDYGAGGLGGLDGFAGQQQQAAKRQRLNQAAVLEDERTARVRALAQRVAEALFLLRTLATHNLGRLATRLDDGARKTLKEMALRELVMDPQGEAVATRLISCLVSAQLEALGAGPGAAAAASAATGGGPPAGLGALGGLAGGVDEVAGGLQAGCPSFFKEDDRTFYQASAKLQAAESAPTPAEREALTREAVALLAQVPASCNLEYIVSRLAYLRFYEGIVEVPLKAAAAADPSGAALRPELGPECAAARQRRDACYAPVLQALRALIDPAAAAAAGGGSGNAAESQKGLSAAEREAYKAALLKAAVRSPDVYFHGVLYGALHDMGAGQELLGLARDSPHLEPWLAREGGMPAGGMAAGAAGTAPIGPLSQRQVSLLRLLAQLHVGRAAYRQAAEVYTALALRRAGPAAPGEGAVALEERLGLLQAALLQARSTGDSGLVERLDSDLKLLRIQAAVAARLQAEHAALSRPAASAPGQQAAAREERLAELERQLAELQRGLRDVSELYNDYAQPNKMWDVCLQVVDFAGGSVEPALARQLWDHTLLAAWEGAGQGQSAALEAVCEVVERLGAMFYPNDVSFPLHHVAWRLEAMACGLWPEAAAPEERGSGSDTGDLTPRTLAAACHGSLPAARRVYDALLARRAPGVSDSDLSNVRLRLQLLRSLLHHCRAVMDELRSGAGAAAISQGPALPLPYLAPGVSVREAGVLAEACDRYALEARRLGGAECEALAREFDAIKQRVEGMGR